MDLLHTSKGELRRRFKQLRLTAQAQVADPLLQVALEQLPAAAASPGRQGQSSAPSNACPSIFKAGHP